MKIDAEMSLVPIYQKVQPAQNIHNKDIEYFNNQRETFVRFSDRGTGYSRTSNTYNRTGNKKGNRPTLGGSIDLYV